MLVDRLLRSIRLLGFVLVGAVSGPGLAHALESVRLIVPNAPEGLSEDLKSASLSVAALSEEEKTAQDVLAAARADYARLVGVLYAKGYYSGVVRISVDGREAAGIAPLEAPDSIDEIVITVRSGPIFRFGVAEVTPLAPETSLPEGFAAGSVAESEIVADAARAAIVGWRRQGHAKADIGGRSLRANHADALLDARIGIDPGPRLRFGDLIIEDGSAVRPRRIEKIAGFPSGQQFTPDALETSANRLRSTGAFRSVTLREADEPNPDGTLDVTARVVDEKPRRLGFGGEVSTTEGATISAFWLHRNFFGGAERFRVGGELGGIGGDTGGTDLSFDVRIDRPATPNADTSAFTELSIANLNEPDFEERKFNIALGFSRILPRNRVGTVALEWQHAKVDDSIGTSDFDTLSLPFTFVWDKRDDVLDATDGHFFRAELRPFAGFGDTSSGLRAYADARVYRPLSDRFVLAGRLQVGSVTGPSVSTAPPDYLFYSGGGGTVRGQSYESLGIDLPSGRRRGGRGYVGLSAEARFGLTDTIGIVGFADAGYVGEDPFPSTDGDWHGGAGLGLRYDTGIGPLRVDIAGPVGGDGDGVQIYIGIGQAF